MTQKFWVGNGGNWNDTTHWSLISGGASGAAVPTLADNVRFDALSFTITGQTVTGNAIMECLDLDWTGIVNAPSFVSSVYSINIYGNLTLWLGLNWSFTGTAYTNLKPVSVCNITGNGTNCSYNILYLDSVNGVFNNLDDFGGNPKLMLNEGTWNTNDHKISIAYIYPQETPNTNNKRILNLGSSRVVTAIFAIAYNNYVKINYGTSTIELYSSNYMYFTTQNNVYNLECKNGLNVWGSGRGPFIINSLTLSNKIVLNNSDFIVENLTILPTASFIRTSIWALTYSNITVDPAKVSIASCDFTNIKFTNPIDLSAITGGSGDCGGNTGITFTPSQTQYYKHTSGACNWTDAKWFTDRLTRVIPGRMPLPQDDPILDAASFTGASTLTINTIIIGRNVDMSGVAFPVAVNTTYAIEIYGNFILGNYITPTTVMVNLLGRGNHDCKTFNKAIWSLSFGSTGTYTLQSDLTTNLQIQTSGYGTTLKGNGFNVTCRYLLNGTALDKIYFGSGTWTYCLPTAGSANSWAYAGTGATTYYETSTVIYTSTYTTMAGVLQVPASGAYNILRIGNIPSIININLTGIFTANQLIVDSNNKIFFLNNQTFTVAKLKALGKPGALITLGSQTPGSKFTLNITSADNLIDYISVSDCTMTTVRPAGLNSVNVSNNTGWDFTSSIIRYWIGDTGNFTDVAHWSLQSGGVSNTIAPTLTENAIWDRNSFTVINQTVTGNAVMNCLTIDWSDVTKACNFISTVYSLNIYGSLILGINVVWNFTGTAYTNMVCTDSRTITNNANPGALFNNLYLGSATAVITHQDNFNAQSNVTLVGGTWNTNDKRFDIQARSIVAANNANIKTINFGSSIVIAKWIVGDNWGQCVFNAGTSTLHATGAQFYTGKLQYYNVTFPGVGSWELWISSNSSAYCELKVTNTLTINGLNSSNARCRFKKYSGAAVCNVTAANVIASNIDIENITFTNPIDLSLVPGGSSDFGGNVNVIFTPSAQLYYKGTTGAHNWDANWKLADRITPARIPLVQDDVFFDAQSFTGPATLTLNQPAICRSMNWTGQNKAVTFTGSVYTLAIYGDLILYAGLTWTFTGTSALYFKAFDDRTIQSSGVTISPNNTYFDGPGSWTNLDTFSVNGYTWLNQGTWNMNGCTINALIRCETGSATRVINMSSSYVTGWFRMIAMTNLIINPGTSTVECNVGYVNGQSGLVKLSLNNVVIKDSGAAGQWLAYLTCNNLTFANTGGTNNSYLNGDVTVTNNLTITGDNTIRRFVSSTVMSAQRTITVDPTKIFATYCEFRDIKFSSPVDLSNVTGGCGDGGGNANITFVTAQTLYYKHTSGACNWADAKWFTTSGGSIVGRTPLLHDLIIFDANSFTGASTLTINVPRIGDLDMSAVNQPISIPAFNMECNGGFVININITFTSAGVNFLALVGNSTHRLETKYIALNGYLNVNRGTYKCESGINLGIYNTSQLSVNGTASLDLNGFNFYGITMNTSNTACTLKMGTGTMYLAGNGSYCSKVVFYPLSNVSNNGTMQFFNTATPSDTHGFNAAGKTINRVVFSGTGTKSLDISNACTINELEITPNKTVKFLAGATINIGKLKAPGKPSALITLSSLTPTSKYTLNITSEDNLIDYISVSDCTMTTPRSAGLNSVNVSNNTGWDFVSSIIRYWIADTGNFTDAAHWSKQSGGVSNTIAPTLTENAIWDRNSFSAISKIVTGDAIMNCLTMDWSDITKSCSFVSSVYNLNIYGSLSLSSLLAWAFTSTAYGYMKAVDSRNITNNGCSIPNYFYINASGTITQQDTMFCLIHCFLTGTYNTNDKTINANSYQFVNGTTSIVNFGNSTLNLANGITVNAGTETLNAGTSTIVVGQSADWFLGGNKTYNNVIVETTNRVMNGYIANFTCVNFTRRVVSNVAVVCNCPVNSNFTVTGILTLTGYDLSSRLLINSYSAGTQRTITADTSKIILAYVDFQDINFTNPIDTTNILGLSGDAGNNSNITFVPSQTQFFKVLSTGTKYWNGLNWFTTSGGSVVSRMPLLHDSIIFDQNSFVGATTLNMNIYRIGKNLDMSLVNQVITVPGTPGIVCYGNFILGTNILSTINLVMSSRTLVNINTYGKTLWNLNQTYASSINLLSDLTVFGGSSFYTGPWGIYVNGYTLSLPFIVYASGGFTLNMGTGTLILTGAYSGNTPLQLSPGTYDFSKATIRVQTAGSGEYNVFSTYAGLINKLILEGACTGNYKLIQWGSYNELLIKEGLKVKMNALATNTIGKIKMLGKPGSLITMYSETPGTKFNLNITSSDNLIDYVSFQDCTFVTPQPVGQNSVNVSNNTGLDFATAIHRYWIGDTGNFNDNNHWSLQSGGVANTTYPTAIVNALVDRNSFSAIGKVITMNGIGNCLTLDLSDITKTASLVGTVYSLNVFGSLTLGVGLTWTFTGTSYLNLKATDIRAITMNGVSAATNRMIFDGVNGTWINQDNMTLSGSYIYLTNGTWNTNNKTINVGIIISQPGTKTLTLGSSDITFGGVILDNNNINLTVNAGTSIVRSLANAFTAATCVFNDLFIRCTNGGISTTFISCNNLTIYNLTNFITGCISIVGNITINKNFNIIGVNNNIYRLMLNSDKNNGIITVDPTKVFASNVDFADIKFATPIDLSAIPGGAGDCGGNSNITFSPAIEQFWVGNAGNWSDQNHWASVSNGIAGSGRMPLPQDFAKVDDASFTVPGTITVNVPRLCKKLDMSSSTKDITFFNNISLSEFYGDFILGPKVISTGTTIAFIGRGTFDMNTFNKTVNVRIKKSATYNLRSDFTGSLLIEGNFYTNDYVLNIITDRLMSYSSSQLWLGNSIVNLITQGIGGELLLNAGGQLFSQNSIINVLSDFPSDVYLSMDGWSLNKVVIDGTFPGNCKITGSNTFNELIIKEGKKIAFAAYATQIFNTIKTLSTHKKKITIGSTIPGTQAMLVKNGLPIVEIENVIISDINASPNEKWYLGDNSKNNGNNSGLIFESSYIPPYSWM